MRTCDGCRYADWKRTKNGRLHPSKGGCCAFEYKLPPLPVSRYWLPSRGSPMPCGGYIERGRDNGAHCPHWAPGEYVPAIDKGDRT